jgi:heme-degrading monooxygenase HmoA
MSRCVTVFRSRLRDDVPDVFWQLATELEEEARAVAGFVEYKVFVAEDGERLSLVVFESPEAEAVWREHVAHRAAQERGRAEFYEAYDVAVCDERRHHAWRRDELTP